MAHLYRLIALIGALFLLSPHANAAFPATRTNPDACTVAPCYNWQGTWSGAGTYSTQTSMCAAYSAYSKATASPGGSYFSGTTPFLTAGCSGYTYRQSDNTIIDAAVAPGPSNRISVTPVSPTYSCPANSTLSGDTCTCDPTYTESGGTCIPPAPVNLCSDLSSANTPAGEYSGSGGVGTYRVCDTAGVSSSGDSSMPGCVVEVDANFAVGPDGARKWVGIGRFTGAKCSPDPGAPPASDGEPAPPSSPDNGQPSNCPSGKVPGTVNGTQVCVDPGTSDPTTKKNTSTNTTTNPDGSTTQTQQETTTNCVGATCTTTTTTTTTTTPPGGGTSTTETTTSAGTCTRGSPGCGDEDREPSRFGGSCAAFSCDGDAIMCAVALEQHKRNCALFSDSSPESDLYESEKGKTGPQYTTEPSVNIGPGSISQSNVLAGSAQCISDKTITVAGNTITLPFSQICSTLQHLGTVLLFIAFLTAYRIVSGR